MRSFPLGDRPWIAGHRGALPELENSLASFRRAVAEGATFVRETRIDGDIVLDVVTGVMPGDNAFATHGHLARVRILGG